MWRLTWRNLAARKVRLIMSTLAIVLGVAFLAGVLTFSHALSTTFAICSPSLSSTASRERWPFSRA